MRISGKRIPLTRLVRGGRFIVAVNIEGVIPPDDPSEPCLEAETVRLLKDVAQPIRELGLSLSSAISPLLSTVESPGFSASSPPVEFPSFKTNSILELT